MSYLTECASWSVLILLLSWAFYVYLHITCKKRLSLPYSMNIFKDLHYIFPNIFLNLLPMYIPSGSVSPHPSQHRLFACINIFKKLPI